MEIKDLVSVVRNQITAPLSKGTVGKQSDHAGKTFLYVQFTPENFLEQGVSWVGLSDTVDCVNTFLRKECLAIWIESFYPDSGAVVSIEDGCKAFLKGVENLSAGFERLGSVIEAREKLQTKAQLIAVGGEDPETGETVQSRLEDPGSEDYFKAVEEIKAINREVMDLRKKESEISAKYAVRAETRKKKKALKEAAAAVASSSEAAESDE